MGRLNVALSGVHLPLKAAAICLEARNSTSAMTEPVRILCEVSIVKGKFMHANACTGCLHAARIQATHEHSQRNVGRGI